MREKGNTGVKRRSIMLPESVIKDLKIIRKKTGAQSDSEVLRRSFQLYKNLVMDQDEIILVDNKTGEKN